MLFTPRRITNTHTLQHNSKQNCDL